MQSLQLLIFRTFRSCFICFHLTVIKRSTHCTERILKSVMYNRAARVLIFCHLTSYMHNCFNVPFPKKLLRPVLQDREKDEKLSNALVDCLDELPHKNMSEDPPRSEVFQVGLRNESRGQRSTASKTTPKLLRESVNAQSLLSVSSHHQPTRTTDHHHSPGP
jgi:hypothetical protein